MNQIIKERILKALLNSSRDLAEARTLPTAARIILAYQGFTEPEQIVISEDEELDLPSGQILGNGGSFELAQALRKADENQIQSELLKVDNLELRSRLTTIVQAVGKIQGSRR